MTAECADTSWDESSDLEAMNREDLVALVVQLRWEIGR